jgi:hypothetical protein
MAPATPLPPAPPSIPDIIVSPSPSSETSDPAFLGASWLRAVPLRDRRRVLFDLEFALQTMRDNPQFAADVLSNPQSPFHIPPQRRSQTPSRSPFLSVPRQRRGVSRRSGLRQNRNRNLQRRSTPPILNPPIDPPREYVFRPPPSPVPEPDPFQQMRGRPTVDGPQFVVIRTLTARVGNLHLRPEPDNLHLRLEPDNRHHHLPLPR